MMIFPATEKRLMKILGVVVPTFFSPETKKAAAQGERLLLERFSKSTPN